MYFNLEANILKYVFSDSNRVYGDTKHLVVSPPVVDAVGDHGFTNTIDYYLASMVETKNACELTITFKPVYRAKYTDIEQAKIIRLLMRAYNLSYILVPEYGNNMNLHYHGIVIGKNNELSKCKKELLKYIGRTELKTIQYTQSYYKYLTKERMNIEPEEYSKLIVYDIK